MEKQKHREAKQPAQAYPAEPRTEPRILNPGLLLHTLNYTALQWQNKCSDRAWDQFSQETTLSLWYHGTVAASAGANYKSHWTHQKISRWQGTLYKGTG